MGVALHVEYMYMLDIAMLLGLNTCEVYILVWLD